MMIKSSVHQKFIIIVNTYAYTYTLNIEMLKYIKQITDLKGEINSNVTAVGGINTPLSIIESSSRQETDAGLELHFRPNGPNGHIQDILSNGSQMHILLRCARNILQDRSCVRSLNKS